VLGLSKKTFKQAIGKLYKYRRIALEADGIRSLNNPRV
jgi:predicted RNA-binding protein (virulence factor B family)